jgi:alpha-glucosidase
VTDHRARLSFQIAAIGAILALAAQARAQEPQVTAPPESFFALVDEADREPARAFYRKYLEIDGMPVVAAEVVADEALVRTREVVTHMLAGRPDVVRALADQKMYLIVIGKDQLYTDMPEYRNHPDPAFQNERVRGTGGRPTSFGEENVLSLPRDRYDDESIAVHEFAHTIDGALGRIDPEWRRRLRQTYRSAMDRGLYRDAYAAGNPGEYWGEIVQSYFDCNRVNNWNHGPVGSREQLLAYDPEGYELVRSTLRLGPGQDWRYTFAQAQPSVTTPPPADLALDPYYTKITWARSFPVVSHGATDAALLRTNDTVRKLFAYRHDILKALIDQGVRLVVLGPDDSLADLPEWSSLKNDPTIDPQARFLPYAAGRSVMAVAEEAVLGDRHAPLVGADPVVRAMASAIHLGTGLREAEPPKDPRDRNIQQYELRVTRMDRGFDERLRAILEAAIGTNLWRGTAAARDHAAYWVEGVLAYFDAQGQVPAPADAARPITTREALAAYDPALFDLIDATMAYRGHVDWRLAPAP